MILGVNINSLREKKLLVVLAFLSASYENHWQSETMKKQDGNGPSLCPIQRSKNVSK